MTRKVKDMSDAERRAAFANMQSGGNRNRSASDYSLPNVRNPKVHAQTVTDRPYPRKGLCPVCGENTEIVGATTDGRLIGGCKDAFTADNWRSQWQEPMVTEKQIRDMSKLLNEGKIRPVDIFGEMYETKELTNEQTRKGYNFLMKRWKTKNGNERKNNPFGYREQHVIENFDHFELADFHDSADYWQVQRGIHRYYPVYDVYGKDGSHFQYYFDGVDVNITC